jgi:hypothetical protein
MIGAVYHVARHEVVIIEREGGKENKKRGEGMEHMETRLMPYLIDSFFFPFHSAIYTLVLPLYL